MKPDFRLPKEIIDKLEIGKWYCVRGIYNGHGNFIWNIKEDKK